MTSTTERLRDSLNSGSTLPAHWYVDPEVLRSEQERIFETTWQYVGRTDQLSQPGDYLNATVGSVPVLVARHPDGTLRGFVNVCRHRCAEVVTAPGRRNVLQCHYHAWCYDLDGRLVSAPRSDREPDFDAAQFSLFPVSVDTWEPFVFVNVGSDPTPLQAHLGELPSIMERDGLDPAAVTFRQHGQWIVAANWKVVVENFDECYHCPVAHPSFSRLMEVDPDGYRLEQGTWWSRAVTSLRPSALRPNANVPYPPSGPLQHGQFGFIWPNLTIVQNPGPPNLMAFWFVPTGPEETKVVMDYWFAPELDDTLVEAIVDFNVAVGMEDQKLVESVQRGLRSGKIAQGRLLLDSERLIQHFQHLVYQSLALPH